MKDPIFYVQSEFFRLLHDSINVDSVTVPLYNLENPASETDGLYMNFNTPYVVPGKSKDNFRPTVRIQVDIINQLVGAEITTQRIESASNQIGQIIIPTPSLNGLQGNSDFDIVRVDLWDNRNMTQRSPTNLIVRKILIFEVLIKQK